MKPYGVGRRPRAIHRDVEIDHDAAINHGTGL